MKLQTVENILLVAIFLFCVGAYFYVDLNNPSYLKLMAEDGLVEWLTVGFLLATAILTSYRVISFKLYKDNHVFLFQLFLIAVFLFVAAEEISWGQRIFGFESGEIFKLINKQKETNLHNIGSSTFSVNKAFFGIGLELIILLYLLAVPYLYINVEKFKSFADKIYLPIPKVMHGIVFVICLRLVLDLDFHEVGEPHDECPRQLHDAAIALLGFVVAVELLEDQRRIVESGTTHRVECQHTIIGGQCLDLVGLRSSSEVVCLSQEPFHLGETIPVPVRGGCRLDLGRRIDSGVAKQYRDLPPRHREGAVDRDCLAEKGQPCQVVAFIRGNPVSLHILLERCQRTSGDPLEILGGL
jgi:hypothetical protein